MSRMVSVSKVIITAFVFSIFSFTENVFGNVNKADSLLNIVRSTEDVNRKIKVLIAYCEDYRYISPDTCLKYIQKYFSEINGELTVTNAKLVKLEGDVYWHMGKPEVSIEKYRTLYEFHKSKGNRKGVSQALGDMGYVEMEQGQYPEALMHYKEALQIARADNDQEYIGVVGLYVSQLYDWLGERDEALKSYHEVRVHFETEKYSKSYGVVMMNIGAVHGNRKGSDSALYYYDLALKYLPPEQEKSIAITKSNIAFVNMTKKMNYPEARKLLDEVRPVFVKLNSKSNIALIDNYDAIYYDDMKDYPKAKSFLLIALDYYKTENNVTRLSMVYDRLSTLYAKLNKFDSAYICQKLFKKFIDSVLIDLSENNMSYERVKFGMDKKQLEIESLEQKQTIQKEQLKQEKTQRTALFGGIILLIVFGIFMFNRFRITQKQKKIIEEQKKMVEEKQKEVMDSINYAKRIQRAHMPSDKYISRKLSELKNK